MYKIWWFSELLPEYKILEEDILDIIKKSYKKYGYTPIETPAMEKTDILTAKWWGEVKNQIFGVYWLAQWKDDLKNYSLRFDLTIPFSRYIMDYRGQITFPFKRSQIWKVWRGERQQRGRSKEFYQADIDVIWDDTLNKNYLFYDSEVILVAYKTYEEIFANFWLKNTTIKININNRKIISGFIDSLWLLSLLSEIWIIIDKKDKISTDKFIEKLQKIGISDINISKIQKFINFDVTFNSLFKIKEDLWIENEEFDTWIRELYEVLNNIYDLWISKESININLSIIRWLAYYTWTVFETFIESDRKLWSIWSWWRYEKLTSYIDKKTSFSWVGFSIWVTRLEDYIFENINTANLSQTTSEYLIINFEDTKKESLELYSKLISEGKNIEFYPETDKLWKQFKYADKKGIKYCVLLWTWELEKGVYTIKDLGSWDVEEIKL